MNARSGGAGLVDIARRTARCCLRPRGIRSALWQPLLLLVLVGGADFFHFRDFGLYEDDYFFIGQPLVWTGAEFVKSLEVIWTWPQGRPIGYLLCYVIAYVAGRMGGLQALYGAAYVVQATNVLLLYFLLRRMGFAVEAWLGSLLFALFPADTTRSFLMHSFGLHSSLTFVLLAAHAHLSNRSAGVHLGALAALLTYETPYPIILAFPLLNLKWEQLSAKRILRHTGTWLVLLVMAVLLRLALGESRAQSLPSDSVGVQETIGRILLSLVWGPFVSLRALWRGPKWSLENWNLELTIVLLVTFLILVATWSWLAKALVNTELSGARDPGGQASGTERSVKTGNGEARTVRLLLAGLAMFILGYGLAFTHFPPTPYVGRLTSVHMAGSLGASIALAAAARLLLTVARLHWIRGLLSALLALYLALAVAYRFSIQQGFVAAWNHQRRFWTSALSVLPDLADRTVVFVPQDGLPEGRFIQAHSWAAPLVLSQLLEFPADWEVHPRLFIVSDDWTDGLERVGNELVWRVPAGADPPHDEILPEGNLILLTWKGGQLQRRWGSVQINGHDFALKPLPDAMPPARPHAPVYALLIDEKQ